MAQVLVTVRARDGCLPAAPTHTIPGRAYVSMLRGVISCIRWFRDIKLTDLALVGGKTASLGDLVP